MLDYSRFSSSCSRMSTFYPVTLVVSPLVSLMQDQTMNLTRIGLPVGSVTVFDASTSLPDQKSILDQLASTPVSFYAVFMCSVLIKSSYGHLCSVFVLDRCPIRVCSSCFLFS